MASRVHCRVEFFGIPRARAGVAETMAAGETVGEILEELAKRFPLLAQTCIVGRTLQTGYTLNLGGTRFLTNSEFRISDGDVLLFMSVDAGG